MKNLCETMPNGVINERIKRLGPISEAINFPGNPRL